MKSIQIGDLRAEIKCLHFLQMGEILAILFQLLMRRLRQQIATVCAIYASKVLPHAPHTLAICYRVRRLRQQNTQFYTVLLPHASHTLANCYCMRRLRQQFATPYASKVLPHAPSTLIRVLRVYPFVLATACAVYASKLLPYAAYASNLLAYAPYTLASFYRMRRIRQQSATACAAYASKVLPHAQYTLTKTHFYTILLAYAPSALAICQRMRRIRQRCATACATYASKVLPHALAKQITG